MSNDIRFMMRLSRMARQVNIPRTTLLRAVESGHLQCWYTKCGLPMTTLEAVMDWLSSEKTRWCLTSPVDIDRKRQQ